MGVGAGGLLLQQVLAQGGLRIGGLQGLQTANHALRARKGGLHVALHTLTGGTAWGH